MFEGFDRGGDADRFLHRPDAVGVETQPVVGKRLGQGVHHLDVVIRRKVPALEFVGPEAALLPELPGVGDDLVGIGLAAALPGLVLVAIEKVGRERDGLADRAAEQVAGANAQLLARQIHAGHLDGGVKLQAVVVEAGRRVHQLPAQLLELQRIVALEVGGERQDRLLGRRARRRRVRRSRIDPDRR